MQDVALMDGERVHRNTSLQRISEIHAEVNVLALRTHRQHHLGATLKQLVQNLMQMDTGRWQVWRQAPECRRPIVDDLDVPDPGRYKPHAAAREEQLADKDSLK